MRPKGSERNKQIAVAFAKLTMCYDESCTEFVHCRGPSSFFGVLEACMPWCVRNAKVGCENPVGVSEVEVNKVLLKAGFKVFRRRERIPGTTKGMRRGKRLWRFRRWIDPCDSIHLTQNLREMHLAFPETRCVDIDRVLISLSSLPGSSDNHLCRKQSPSLCEPTESDSDKGELCRFLVMPTSTNLHMWWSETYVNVPHPDPEGSCPRSRTSFNDNQPTKVKNSSPALHRAACSASVRQPSEPADRPTEQSAPPDGQQAQPASLDEVLHGGMLGPLDPAVMDVDPGDPPPLPPTAALLAPPPTPGDFHHAGEAPAAGRAGALGPSHCPDWARPAVILLGEVRAHSRRCTSTIVILQSRLQMAMRTVWHLQK